MISPHLLVTTPASTGAARRLTTKENVKIALVIPSGTTTFDAYIEQLIDRASLAAARYCNLAVDAIGSLPTFGAETLTATWYATETPRASTLVLPWRAPVTAISSIVEAGATLTAGADYALTGGGMVERLSADSPTPWSTGKIVAVYIAGWTLPAGVPPDVEQAVIEQVKMTYYARDRDPGVRSETVPDVYQVSYSVAGGSTMGDSGLLPQLESALNVYKNVAVR